MNDPSPRVLQRLSGVLGLPYRRLMELADYVMPDDAGTADSPDRPDEAEPVAAGVQAPAPTNDELLRQLEAVRRGLAELKAGQRQLAQTLERIARIEP